MYIIYIQFSLSAFRDNFGSVNVMDVNIIMTDIIRCATCCGQYKDLILKKTRLNKNQKKYFKALNSKAKWDVKDLKYMFIDSTTSGKTEDVGYSNYNIVAWTSTQKKNFALALNAWANASVFTFTETTTKSEANIKAYMIDDASYGYLGHAFFPFSVSNKGKTSISNNNASYSNFPPGSYDYITMIHEIGHLLGLAHPHDNGGLSTKFPGVNVWSDLGKNQQNQTMYTIMSYNDINGPLTPDNVQSYGFPETPMAYDIIAIQKIYGKPTGKNIGDNTYTLPSVNGEGSTYVGIFDQGGNDTITASGVTDDVTIMLNAARGNGKPANGGGRVSKVDGIDGGFTIAKGVVIENAVGGDGDDTIMGNSANNTLEGGAGNDTFYISKGMDTIDGEEGSADVAIFRFKRKHYKIIKLASNQWRFVPRKRIKSKVGTSTLTDVEYVRFRNGKGYLRALADISVNVDKS